MIASSFDNPFTLSLTGLGLMNFFFVIFDHIRESLIQREGLVKDMMNGAINLRKAFTASPAYPIGIPQEAVAAE